MQKRSEAGKAEKLFFRTKLKHTAIVVLCVMFALSTIYAVDISTYKLIENEKDRYAMRISPQGDHMLRIDVAGNRYDVNAQSLRAFADIITQKAKDLMGNVKNRLN